MLTQALPSGHAGGDQWVAVLDDAPQGRGNLVQVSGHGTDIDEEAEERSSVPRPIMGRPPHPRVATQVGGRDGNVAWPACMLWTEILQVQPDNTPPVADQHAAEQMGNGLSDPSTICTSGHCSYIACCPTQDPPLGTCAPSPPSVQRARPLVASKQPP